MISRPRGRSLCLAVELGGVPRDIGFAVSVYPDLVLPHEISVAVCCHFFKRIRDISRFRAASCATTQVSVVRSISPMKKHFPEGADDGIRTHTPLFAGTDFKSVASAISPHRRL